MEGRKILKVFGLKKELDRAAVSAGEELLVRGGGDMEGGVEGKEADEIRSPPLPDATQK